MGCCTVLFLVLSAAVYVHLRISPQCGDVPPSFALEGQPPRVVLVDLQGGGDNLVLPCRVTGTPTPTVSWFMNNTLIDQASIKADGTLSVRVTEAEAPYEGIIYYCIATNMIGPGNSTVAALRSRDVLVSSPSFREPEVATVEGGDVALECGFNPSNLAFNFTWFVNDVMITKTSRIQFLEGGRYLYVQELTAAERGMRYHCEVHLNGLPLRLPTNYTLNTDIEPGILIVYKNQSTVLGRVGVPVEVVFVAAAIHTAGTAALNIFLDCLDNKLVDFGEAVGTATSVTLLEPARTMDQVTFTCGLLAVDLPRIIVSGTIILMSAPANIIIPMPDDRSLTDRDRLVGGGPVEYSCQASGSPTPTITWYYNGAVVQSGSGGVVVGGDGTLTISAPQVSHSGIYQCFARNQFGDDSRTRILEVMDPVIGILSFNSISEITETSQGDLLLLSSATTDLVITSMVDSTIIRDLLTCDSCPQVQWKVNGTNITNNSDYIVSSPCNDDFSSPFTFTLTIANLTAETSGNYSVVFTLLGAVRESPGLFITSSAISTSIGITGPDKPLDVGSGLKLQCMFIEIFPTNVLWSRDGTNLNSNNRINIARVMNGLSTLRISSVTVEDGGVYTCSARSEVDHVDRSIRVEIPNSGGGVGYDVVGVTGILVVACLEIL